MLEAIAVIITSFVYELTHLVSYRATAVVDIPKLMIIGITIEEITGLCGSR